MSETKRNRIKTKARPSQLLSFSVRLNRDALYKIYSGQILLEFTNPLYMLKVHLFYLPQWSLG